MVCVSLAASGRRAGSDHGQEADVSKNLVYLQLVSF